MSGKYQESMCVLPESANCLSKPRSNNKGNRMFWPWRPFQLFSLTPEEGLFGRNVLFPLLLLCDLLKEWLIQLSQRSNEPL